EIQVKAVDYADALEAAHQMEVHGGPKAEIAAGFLLAEDKRNNLNQYSQSEKETDRLTEPQPVTLKIYERELRRNERAIAQNRISEMLESGEISLADFETKKIGEIFPLAMRDEIRLEAGERTHEDLEPKELWMNRQNTSENLQEAALKATDALEQ